MNGKVSQTIARILIQIQLNSAIAELQVLDRLPPIVLIVCTSLVKIKTCIFYSIIIDIQIIINDVSGSCIDLA